MSLTAIQSAGDAIDITREYLFGRSLRQFVTLAFMVLFLGPTGLSGPPGPVEFDDEVFGGEGSFPSPAEIIDAIDIELAIIAISIVAVFTILYGLVSAFMEFGFIHSLVTDTAAIRNPASDHWPRALSLFVFRAIVWGVITMTIALLTAQAIGVIDLPIDPMDTLSLLGLVFVGGIFYLLNRFTTDFVAPIMYHERRGLLASWGRLLEVMRLQWRQFAVYVPVRIILEVALGIAFGVVTAILLFAMAVVIGIPVGVVLVLLFGTLPGILTTITVLAVLAIALVAVALVPFHTYLRYYTLLVLGDTSPSLDLIPGSRSRI